MATVTNYREVHVNQNVTLEILAGETVSGALDCAGTTLCAIRADEQLSEATLNFLVTNDTTVPAALLYNTADSLLISVVVPTLGAGEAAWIQIPPAVFAGLRYFAVVSDVAPAQNSTLYCAVRPV
ncbi:MAG: hypothetical protein COY58_05940 [Gammaproteobacteria bacterium CG_4_10_14_0_8_um_filter_38_16]|nr:MAG: hypothetical protein COY58_05940 [Gammaproteobacteria bacterium CG_4_10_14_0_8_um_filter_38_16]